MSQSVNTCSLFSNMLVHWNETETNKNKKAQLSLTNPRVAV